MGFFCLFFFLHVRIKTNKKFRFKAMQKNSFSAYLTNHLLMENLNIYKIKSLLHAGEGNLSFAY